MKGTDVPIADSGSEDAFLRLFVQSERSLLRAIMTMVPNPADARDVLQETAAALWTKRGEYDPSRPFAVWACGFALNQARAFLRAESRRRVRLGAKAEELLASRREELQEEFDARHRHLRECVEALPASHRDLVRGYYFEERNVEALAGQTSRTVDAVYKTLQRARAALLACVQRKLQAEEGR